MEQILRDGLAALGIPATADQVQKLADYGRLLLKTNETTNLTAIRQADGVARLHFLDCAALLTVADFSGQRVLDMGSGAGFPGIPLRLLQPDIQLTCVDSVGKKMDFVKMACQSLDITGVECLWARVEELPQLRERYDRAVSRAVAELDVLAELCLPQVKVGGLFIAMKGPDCQDEVSQATFAIKALGGRVQDVVRYPIPGTDVTHAAVVVEKVKATPPQYPRRYAQIKKNPLRG
jgi:16S rRNA (guanine527-N7)-methyltransferase